MISKYQLFKACLNVRKRLFCPNYRENIYAAKLTVILLLSAVLNGSVPAVANGSVEDCLKKQSLAKGSEPLKGSPPKGSKNTHLISISASFT